MTTPQAAEAYLSEHRKMWHGTPYVVWNPHDQPTHMLPTIYGFNNSAGGGDQFGELVAEDGTPLGGHICSHEGYMLADLGILEGCRADRHEGFRKYYPDGYRMDFVPKSEVPSHAGLNAALKRHDEKYPPETR